jgi:hypothetical protein
MMMMMMMMMKYNFRCARTPTGAATKARRGNGGNKPRSLAVLFDSLNVVAAVDSPGTSSHITSTPTDHAYTNQSDTSLLSSQFMPSVTSTPVTVDLLHESTEATPVTVDHEYVRDLSHESTAAQEQTLDKTKTMMDNVLFANADTTNTNADTTPPTDLTAEWCLQNSGVQWNKNYVPSKTTLESREVDLLQRALQTEDISSILSVSYGECYSLQHSTV